MGTSTSSSGPLSNISFDPPWLDELIGDLRSPADVLTGNNISPNLLLPPPPAMDILAPPARFKEAKRALSHFIKTNETKSLKKALGKYSSTGMGGATRLSHRMRLPVATGAIVFSFLAGLQANSSPEVKAWIDKVQSQKLSSVAILNEILQMVMPHTGTLDEESTKKCIIDAQHDLFDRHEDADILNLSTEKIDCLMESFLVFTARERIISDMGLQLEKLSPSVANTKIKEIESFLRAEFEIQLSKNRESNKNYDAKSLQEIFNSIIKTTFEIFEEGE